MIHVEVEQNTDEWYTEKLGKPSASNADKLMTLDLKPSKQREAYMNELAAEIVTGQRDPNGYQSGYMGVGQERQEECKQLYELLHDCQVTKAGVCYPDRKKLFLCSPDGLIEESHGLEMKNVAPKTQVKYLLKNELPTEYFPQIQFSLLVTGFKFWDFMSYSPGLKPLIVRVQRDEKYIAALQRELVTFCAELNQIVKKIT